MSYLFVNSANQGETSGTHVVIISGNPLVGIVGSVGSTTIVDVQGNVDSDARSLGTDALSVENYNMGFRDQSGIFSGWARLRVIPLNQENYLPKVPISGMALQTAAFITSVGGYTASVFQADDDDMFEQDTLLQTAGRAYGLANENGQSGRTWVRIGATASGAVVSGVGHALVVAPAIYDSGAKRWTNMVTSDSGKNFLMVTVGDQRNDGDRARVFTCDANFQVDATDTGMIVDSVNYGWDSMISGYNAFRVTSSGKGISGVHHKLIVAFSGDPVSISGQPVSVSISGIAINVSGNIVNTSGQAAIISGQPVAINSGKVQIGVPNFSTGIEGLGTFDDAITNGLDSLSTVGFNIGYDQVVGDWKRIRVTSSGQGMSGIVHKLAVAFSGDPVSVSGNIVNTSGQNVAFSGNVVQIGQGGTTADVHAQFDDAMANTANALAVAGHMLGYHQSGDVWPRVRLVPLQSGQTNTQSGFGLVTASRIFGTSGRIAEVNSRSFDDGAPSDQGLMTSASLIGYNDNAGEWKRIRITDSGGGFGAAGALIVADTPGCNNFDANRTTITNLSGGTALNNVTCRGRVFVQNESGNNAMNVGGNNAGDFPNANLGITLFSNERIDLKVTNANLIAVWAATSGQRVRVLIEN